MKALSKRFRWIAIGVFAVLATLLTYTLYLGPFYSYSVCDKCGAEQGTTEWQLPMAHCTVFSHSTEFETPLSRALLTNGIVPPHQHHWLFAVGGGNGVRCATGEGMHIQTSEKVAALVLALHQHGLFEYRDRVLKCLFNPKTSQVIRGLSYSAPKTPMTAIEMQNWITEQFESLDDLLGDGR